MTDRNSKIAKPTNQKEIASTLPKKTKPKRFRYVQGEEPESSSISSYARGRISSVQE